MPAFPDDVPTTTEPSGPTRRDVVRRGLGLGLGAAALPTLLAACGDSNDDKAAGGAGPADGDDAGGTDAKNTDSGTTGGDDDGSGDASKPEPTTAKLSPETPGVIYPKGYVGPKARQTKPFGDRKTVFTVVVPEDTTVVGDWNKNSFTAWFEKRTGVKVKFQTVSTSGGDMTKVNAMIASGDLPDAFMGIPFTRDQISLYGAQGVFQPLDEHISKYAAQLQAAYHDYPDLGKLVKSADGKTYAFPSLNDCYHCLSGDARTWINKNFIDAGGGKVPETTEEFRAFLKALKTNDASGHGDTVPLVAGVDNAIDRYFMNSFMYNPGEPWLRVDDGKVDFVANKPQWREGLKYLRTLFDDGTLSPSIFTMTSQALQKIGNTPGHARIGVARTWDWGSFVDITYEKNARWRDYETMSPLKGPDGVRYAAWDYYNYTYGLNQVIISKACEHPDVLVRWAEYQMELEATMGAYAGTHVTNWDWSKKGTTSIMGKQAIYWTKLWPAKVNTSWDQYSAMYRTNDFRLGQQADPKNPTFEQPLYEESKKAYEPYKQPKEFQLPPLIFDQASAATNADTALAISNHVKQSMAQFATAKLDVHDDNVWNTYTDKIGKMGLAPYLANQQKSYDNQSKA